MRVNLTATLAAIPRGPNCDNAQKSLHITTAFKPRVRDKREAAPITRDFMNKKNKYVAGQGDCYQYNGRG